MLIFNFKKQKERGYTLVEVLIYVTIFAIVSLAVINGVLISMRTFRVANENRVLARAGVDIVERMSREIRSASSIDQLVSNFESSSGSLGLVSLSEEGEVLAELSLDDGEIMLTEDNVIVGPLSSEAVVVSSLTFYEVVTAQGEAVRFEVVLSSSGSNKSIMLKNTVGLRGSY